MRKLLVSNSLGVYLGSCMGMGFWSKLDHIDLFEAITFESEKAIHEVLATWECLKDLPSDFRFLDIEPDSGPYASMECCVRAGAMPWGVDKEQDDRREIEPEPGEARQYRRSIPSNYHE